MKAERNAMAKPGGARPDAPRRVLLAVIAKHPEASKMCLRTFDKPNRRLWPILWHPLQPSVLTGCHFPR